NYSCLEARFYMRRDVGYHIANTYVPTTICVVFSWISVWLPEEFVEGRIFVSLTVFLTLSAENNSAKEELPKVSYVKAIDIWFGFTSTFVFVTMLQALTVISFEHQSKLMREKAEKQMDQYSKLHMTKAFLLHRYYHKQARNLDTFCKLIHDVELKLCCLWFLSSTICSIVGLIFLPFQWILSLLVVEFIASYMLGSTRGSRPLCTLQATVLGAVLGLTVASSFSTDYEPLQIFCRYVSLFVIFHFSEYFFTAISNRRSLQPDSFLLNHSTAYWVAAITSWVEFWVETYFFPSIKCSSISSVGVFLVLVGECLRKLAMLHAGSGFTHRLAQTKRPDHRLTTTGVYALIRHPGYSGWFLWSVSTQLVLCNPICIFAYAYVSWLFFEERILDEEKDLLRFFGQQYADYQRKVWVGLPFIKGYRSSEPRSPAQMRLNFDD
ncbi:hypothetical protein WR25_19451, partial [Diploscapter pachys]